MALHSMFSPSASKSFAMFKTFCKIAVRGLLRHRAFSIINISGLAIGMGSAVLIGLWILHEFSYDRTYPKQARLYELMTNNQANGTIWTGTPTPEVMPPYIQKDIPQVESVARLGWNDNILFHYKDKSVRAEGASADPAFLTMFDLPMTKGDAATALDDPYSIVLTEHMAKSIFGSENPMGKLLGIDNTNWTVSGVMKDLPDNTQFNFTWLNSYHFKEVRHYIDSDWTDVNNRAFVLLKPHATAAAANALLKGMAVAYSRGKTATEAFIYPMGRMRLYSDFENGKPAGGRIGTVRIFGLIALLILLIACINFMNLSTARSERRAKEVGIRKAIGARRQSLVTQFLGESLLVTFLAALLALLLVQLCLPAFGSLTQKDLSIPYTSPFFWVGAVAFIILTGVLAGSYPAFFLSAFRPVSVLKGTLLKIRGLVTPRKVLVVVQFSVAIVLVVSTLVILRQVRYAQGRKTGYDQQSLIYVSMEGDIPQHYEAIRSDLLNSGAVTSMTALGNPLTQTWSSGSHLTWPGSPADEQITFMRAATDGNAVQTLGLKLVQGRDIDIRKYPSDSTACLINEAAVKAMGVKSPLGTPIFDDPLNWHVVGVIKDFVLGSPYEAIKPLIIKGPRYGIGNLHLRLNGNHPTAENLAVIARILKTYNPSYPFEYHFLDEEYARHFAGGQQTAGLAALFAGLAIFISCLGLFGLVTYMAESRTKEIGIRKVLGASALRVVVLLSSSFARLVVFSIVVATPLAWYVMSRWLQGYNYRVSLDGWPFVLAGAGALFIALATVSFQAIRAALANPVNSLRNE